MPPPDNTVIFIEGHRAHRSASHHGSHQPEGRLSQEKEIEGGPQMRALIRAGRELAGNHAAGRAFQAHHESLGGSRGRNARRADDARRQRIGGASAARGEGFRISSTVRDRVINEKASLLVRDARLDEAFAERMSIVQQQIRSMLAVPLQTDDRVIGLIYLDSPHFIHGVQQGRS